MDLQATSHLAGALSKTDCCGHFERLSKQVQSATDSSWKTHESIPNEGHGHERKERLFFATIPSLRYSILQEPFTGTAVMKNGVSGFGLWVNPNGVPNRAYFMGHC
ncbi:hypothetical protein WJX82_004184 [Trebouxia sp. C0006]